MADGFSVDTFDGGVNVFGLLGVLPAVLPGRPGFKGTVITWRGVTGAGFIAGGGTDVLTGGVAGVTGAG